MYDDDYEVECQHLADYWMNEQEYYDVEIVPVRDEVRLTLSHGGDEFTDWFDTLDQVEAHLDRIMVRTPVFAR